MDKFLVLHVDGIGDYGVAREQGGRCLFVFTSLAAMAAFVDRLEAPDFRDSTAIEFTRSQLREVAADLYRWIAVDPPHETKFYPVDVESFFDDESHKKASWN